MTSMYSRIIVKGISADHACAAAQCIIATDPIITHLAPNIAAETFSAEGYVGLGCTSASPLVQMLS